MKKLLLTMGAIGVMLTGLWAQVGGLFTYEFLQLAPSARVTALGGTHIAVMDDDVNLAALNPALLNPAMHKQLGFSHAFHPAGIQYGYVTGAWEAVRWKTTLQAGIRYANYGDLDLTNDLGVVEGQFKAQEQALTLGAGRMLNERIGAGVNLKLVNSRLESYQSLGLVSDLALFYQDTARRLTFTAVAHNAGVQLRNYREGNEEPLPFEVQLGVSKRLQHLPFRFSVIYRYFDRWNILYDDPNNREETLFLGQEPTERSKTELWMDNLFRHFVFNGELLIGAKENFRLRLGYSHLQRREMQLSELRSFAGFSFGFGIKVNRFRLDYGRGTYQLGASVNHLSVSTNLREFTGR